jgi:two-component system, OmpR family, sensor histidine kinase BaeS
MQGGQTIGWLGVRAGPPFDDALDLAYLQETKRQLLGITAAAIGVSVLAGWLLTRRLLKPIFELSVAARRLAGGTYDVRVRVLANDELGQLGADFNALAQTLGEADTSRRHWVADTSHELRTPLTVLRAEIEALLDGVRPIERPALLSLQSEVSRLNALVEDLGELARWDQGVLSVTRLRLSPVEVLARSVASFRPRFEARKMSLTFDVGAGRWWVMADQRRLEQVFANLLENSLRYTDAGGTLRVSVHEGASAVVLRFEDSLPGVAPADLPRLFERFFRADASRSRDHGGAGLGLAICLRLVELHQGTIAASQSPLGGLRVDVSLPLAPVSRS